MPATQQNPKVRLLVTLGIVGAAVGLVIGLILAANNQPNTPIPPAGGNAQAQTTPNTPEPPEAAEPAESPGSQEPQTTRDTPEDPANGAAASQDPPNDARAADEPATDPPVAGAVDATTPTAVAAAGAWSVDQLRAVVMPAAAPPATLGSLTDPSIAAEIRFTFAGAGVESVTMSDYYATAEDDAAARRGTTLNGNPPRHYAMQRRAAGQDLAVSPLMALGVSVGGRYVSLVNASGQAVWRETAPGAFEAEIVAGAEDAPTPVLRITRRFELRPDSFELAVEQRIENLSGRDLRLRWVQYGPVDIDEEFTGYRLDTRRVRFGYLLPPGRDASRQIVRADEELRERKPLLEGLAPGASQLVWPDPDRYNNPGPISWVAQTNRYFVFAVHPLIDPDAAAKNIDDPSAHPIDKRSSLIEEVYATNVLDDVGGAHLVLQLNSPEVTASPGGTVDLSFGAYAGPLAIHYLSGDDDPTHEALGMDGLVVFQIGFCGFCTFQPIARGLLGLLELFQGFITFDWALAIMLLVICVRGALHPITRRSQISMMRFGKQMQRIAPKQKKLQEKYKDDRKKLQEEMVRLMREERVNYAGMLGCLPMLLQSPIWIALYAMLYFTFDLRHEPAFFGFFQSITGGHWLFLADLASPDRLFALPFSFELPLMGTISSFNILPLALGVVFYIHQKYMTPPSTGQLSPEQEQTQKIMKVMMVVMFPVFMYNAPSGLSLYFITNSTLGIVESRWIRAQADKLDLGAPTPARSAQPARRRVSNEASPGNPFKKSSATPKNRFKDRR